MPLKEKLDEVRRRYPFLDHLIRMQLHFGSVKGVQQAGAITYFGFISVFPILAVAFAVVGLIARINPVPDINITEVLEDAIGEVLPGIPTEGIVSAAQEGAPGILSVGLVVVLYSGLGWLSAMRNGMLVVFRLPEERQPNFFVGKLRDLMSLALIGTTMLITVSLAGVVNGISSWFLDHVPTFGTQEWLLTAIGAAVGLAANTLLFYAIFRLLAKPGLPPRSLWKGALFGAIGFEVLKQVAWLLIGATQERPAFQVFGIALILVVWINYFARVLMYAAAFAYTSPAARAQRLEQAVPEEAYHPDTPLSLEQLRTIPEHPEPSRAVRRVVAVGTGAALGAAGAAVVLARRTHADKES